MFGRLGWTISADGKFAGPGNVRFNVFCTPPSEIKNCIQLSWAVEVQNSVKDRSGLGLVPLPSRVITQKLFQHFQPWEQQILARHVSGAFLSNAEKSTWSRIVGPECPLCGDLDTKHHRLYQCRAHEDVRAEHEEIVQSAQQQFPWWPHLLAATEPEELSMFRLLCSTRVLPALLPPPSSQSKVFLFTDGSAHNSSSSDARLTYWSVVHCHALAHLESLGDWDLLCVRDKVAGFSVVAQGCTPGCQTVPRAELAAVAWAAGWVSQDPLLEAVLFTDSQYAMDQWQMLANWGHCLFRVR